MQDKDKKTGVCLIWCCFAALMMSLKLNEKDLIRHVVESIAHRDSKWTTNQIPITEIFMVILESLIS